MDITKIAYIAGLIDGEGTITIRKLTTEFKKGILKGPTFQEVIMIGMNATDKNLEALKMIKFYFGGVLSIEKKIYNSKNSYKSNYPRARYIATNRIANNLLKTVYPFLIIKKEQVDLVFKLRESINKTWEQRKNLKGFETIVLDKKVYQYREELWKQIKALHH